VRAARREPIDDDLIATVRLLEEMRRSPTRRAAVARAAERSARARVLERTPRSTSPAAGQEVRAARREPIDDDLIATVRLLEEMRRSPTRRAAVARAAERLARGRVLELGAATSADPGGEGSGDAAAGAALGAQEASPHAAEPRSRCSQAAGERAVTGDVLPECQGAEELAPDSPAGGEVSPLTPLSTVSEE